MFGGDFGYDDLFQQAAGVLLLVGPFVVAEEVWRLASMMSWGQTLCMVALVLLIGYGTLYEADVERDEYNELMYLGIPTRYVTLILIAYTTPTILALLMAAPSTFDASGATVVKAIGISALFSVMGAATADSIF